MKKNLNLNRRIIELSYNQQDYTPEYKQAFTYFQERLKNVPFLDILDEEFSLFNKHYGLFENSITQSYLKDFINKELISNYYIDKEKTFILFTFFCNMGNFLNDDTKNFFIAEFNLNFENYNLNAYEEYFINNIRHLQNIHKFENIDFYKYHNIDNQKVFLLSKILNNSSMQFNYITFYETKLFDKLYDYFKANSYSEIDRKNFISNSLSPYIVDAGLTKLKSIRSSLRITQPISELDLNQKIPFSNTHPLVRAIQSRMYLIAKNYIDANPNNINNEQCRQSFLHIMNLYRNTPKPIQLSSHDRSRIYKILDFIIPKLVFDKKLLDQYFNNNMKLTTYSNNHTKKVNILNVYFSNRINSTQLSKTLGMLDFFKHNGYDFKNTLYVNPISILTSVNMEYIESKPYIDSAIKFIKKIPIDIELCNKHCHHHIQKLNNIDSNSLSIISDHHGNDYYTSLLFSLKKLVDDNLITLNNDNIELIKTTSLNIRKIKPPVFFQSEGIVKFFHNLDQLNLSLQAKKIDQNIIAHESESKKRKI